MQANSSWGGLKIKVLMRKALSSLGRGSNLGRKVRDKGSG